MVVMEFAKGLAWTWFYAGIALAVLAWATGNLDTDLANKALTP